MPFALLGDFWHLLSDILRNFLFERFRFRTAVLLRASRLDAVSIVLLKLDWHATGSAGLHLSMLLSMLCIVGVSNHMRLLC